MDSTSSNKHVKYNLKGWQLLVIAGIFYWSSGLMYDTTEYVLINNVYGTDAWDSGLHVIDNKGNLSDGTGLSFTHNRILYGGSFILTLPFFFGSSFVLAYVNKRLQEKRDRI